MSVVGMGRPASLAPQQGGAPTAVVWRAVWRLRLALGALMTLGAVAFLWGVAWDVEWHGEVGRDQTFTPPHLVILGGITLCGLAALADVLIETPWTRRALRQGTLSPTATPDPFAGVFYGALGAYLAGFAAVTAAIGFPLDNYWHALNGIDVSIWAPFHVMIIGSMILVTVGVAFTLGSAAWLASEAGARTAATLARVTLVVALATLMGVALILASPAAHGVIRAPVIGALSLYPFLVAALGLFALAVAARALPWPLMATAVTLVFLVLRQAIIWFVPPAMNALAQAQHETFLRHIQGPPVAAAAMSPWLLLAALAMDVVMFVARRRAWSPRATLWTLVGGASVAALVVGGVGLAALVGAVSVGKRAVRVAAVAPHTHGVLLIGALSLALAIPGALLAVWAGWRMGETIAD